jgi:hypothetical protein
MAALLGSAKLSDNQRVELYEDGLLWLAQVEQGKVVKEFRLDAVAVGWLIDFLLLHVDEFDREQSSEYHGSDA